jgi:hypothetical protein
MFAYEYILNAGVDLSSHTFGTERDGQMRFLFDTSLWAALEEDDAAQEDDEDKIETLEAGVCMCMCAGPGVFASSHCLRARCSMVVSLFPFKKKKF